MGVKAYMWNLEMAQMKLFAKQKQTHGPREQMCEYKVGKGGQNWRNWEIGIDHIHAVDATCKIDN